MGGEVKESEDWKEVLPEDLRRTFNTLSPEEQSRVRQLWEHHARQINHELKALPKSRLSIAVCGPVSSGKSALVHAMMDIPKDQEPKVDCRSGTTVAPHRYLLKECVEIIDLPGFGDPVSVIDDDRKGFVDEFHTAYDSSLLAYVKEHADFAILCISKSVEESHRSLYLKLSKNCKKVFVVFTFADLFKKNQIAKLEEQIRTKLGLPDEEKIYRTSCRNYDEDDEDEPVHSGITGENGLLQGIFFYLNMLSDSDLKSFFLAKASADKEIRKTKGIAVVVVTCLSTSAVVIAPYGTYITPVILYFGIKTLANLYSRSIDDSEIKKFLYDWMWQLLPRVMVLAATSWIPGIALLDAAEAVISVSIAIAVMSSALLAFDRGLSLVQSKELDSICGKIRSQVSISAIRERGIKDAATDLIKNFGSDADLDEKEIKESGAVDEAFLKMAREEFQGFSTSCILCGNKSFLFSGVAFLECQHFHDVCSSCASASEKSLAKVCPTCKTSSKIVPAYGVGDACGICLDAEVGTALLPCGHGLCDRDAGAFVGKWCPFCRAPIVELLKLKVN